MKASRVVTALLLALVLVLPILEGGASPLGLFVAHTLVLGIVAAVLVRGARRGTRFQAGWEAPAALVFVLANLIALVRTDYLFGPFLSIWNLGVAVLLGAALFFGDAARPSWRAAAMVVAGSSLAQALHVLLVPARPNMSPSGSFANANQLAAYLVIGALVSAGLGLDALTRRQGGRVAMVLGWGIALVDLAGLLRIGSRGAGLAIVLATALWIGRASAHLTRRWRLGLWAALLLIGVMAGAAVAARFDRLDDPYRFERIRIWQAGLRAAAESPVTGIGPGMFERRGYRFNFPLEERPFRFSKTPGSTHSTYLQALVESGVPGFIALLALAGILGVRLWPWTGGPGGHAASGVAIAVFACLFMGLVDTPFDVPAVTLTLVALAAPLLAPRQPDEAAVMLDLPAASSPDATRRPEVGWASALAGLLFVWAGAVGIPYAAHACFEQAMATSGADAASAGLDRAMRLNPLNPLYPATRADRSWDRSVPLTPGVLASTHLDLQRAHRLDPGNPDHLFRLAQLHARAWFEIRADEATAARAERLYRRGLALGRMDPRPRLELAAFLVARGRREDGLIEIREALRIEPKFLMARLALCRALLEGGDRPAAAAELARLQAVVSELAGYAPANGYERDLMLFEPAALADLVSRLR